MNTYRPLFSNHIPTRRERWDRLAEFSAFWHHVECPAVEDVRPRLQTDTGLPLPLALIEWHARFGRLINLRPDCACTLPIDRLRIDDDTLIIRSEAVFEGRLEAKWGIPIVDTPSDDPPVVGMLRKKTHPCAASVSEFAIYSALFEACNDPQFGDIDCDDETPLPPDGQIAQFPPSFGIIDTEIYEGMNWIALVSGTDCCLRRRNPDSNADDFIRHRVPTQRLP